MVPFQIGNLIDFNIFNILNLLKMISKSKKFAAAIIIINHLNENKNKRKKRSVWGRNWVKRRNNLGAYTIECVYGVYTL